MKPEKDSYIVIKVGKKFKLGFAHNPERNTCYLEDTLHSDEPETFEYDDKTLVACLGLEPECGKVFGIHIEPKRAEKLYPVGMVHYFRRMTKLEKKALRSAMETIVPLFEKYGLPTDIFPIARIEVRAAKGKYAGLYKYKLVDGKAEDTVILYPQTFEDLKYNLYVLAHEFGHALWYRKVADNYRAKWLELYNTFTVVNKAKRVRLEQMLKALLDSQGTVREFGRELDLEDAALFKEVLTYLKRYHKLTPEHVNLLLNNNSVLLGEMWPTAAALSESENPISVYAGSSVEETFAESVALLVTGKQLPKKFDLLMQRTIKHMRHGK